MAIEVTPTGQPCGARVTGVDLTSPLSDDEVAAIRAAWLDHHVLVFPDQPVSDDDLERFTLYFGPFGHDPFFEAIDGREHIAAIHRLPDEQAPLFAESWHADWTFQAFPPDGTCLASKVVPPSGGDTLYANQAAALAAMPATLRAKIDGKIAVHSARTAYAPDGMYGEADGDDRSMRIVVSDEAYDTQTHPLIRVHPESGVEVVYSTFGYIVGIEGMPDDEAAELLIELYKWQTRDEFVYRHVWEPNMVTMWDNRCVLHRATGGFEGFERLLHRTTIGYNPNVGTRVA
ncbi:MAG: TauD/TfdA family dioxygenase [Acidimicrobiales bacterium]|nr:TauD/TfdA family dioxygenase [Acidimicrobiales bacterium]